MNVATFRRTRHGHFSLTLHPSEADLLASLAREVLELLEVPAPAPQRPVDPLQAELGLHDLPSFDTPLDGLAGDGPLAPPEDEVLRRLLPNAYGDEDPAASAEFRRFTEGGLRERKAAAASSLLASLAPSRDRAAGSSSTPTARAPGSPRSTTSGSRSAPASA